MTEPEKNKEAADESQDWAIIPFDKAEDEARWTKLIEETNQLIEDVAETEAVYGKLLMKNKLSEIKITEKQADDELF